MLNMPNSIKFCTYGPIGDVKYAYYEIKFCCINRWHRSGRIWFIPIRKIEFYRYPERICYTSYSWIHCFFQTMRKLFLNIAMAICYYHLCEFCCSIKFISATKPRNGIFHFMSLVCGRFKGQWENGISGNHYQHQNGWWSNTVVTSSSSPVPHPFSVSLHFNPFLTVSVHSSKYSLVNISKCH